MQRVSDVPRGIWPSWGGSVKQGGESDRPPESRHKRGSAALALRADPPLCTRHRRERRWSSPGLWGPPSSGLSVPTRGPSPLLRTTGEPSNEYGLGHTTVTAFPRSSSLSATAPGKAPPLASNSTGQGHGHNSTHTSHPPPPPHTPRPPTPSPRGWRHTVTQPKQHRVRAVV